MQANAISLDLKIVHRNWEDALSLAFALLISALPGEVVCIAGPSRVGKSRLIKELCKLLVGSDKFEDTGLLPTVVVNATNAGPNGTFSTKAITQRMLKAVRHPLLSVIGDEANIEFALQKMDRMTESSMRLALERAIQSRGVKYLFIDEAQHAQYVSKNAQGAFAVMDSWKCLAQSTGIVLVVVGAYPILQIIRNSPHLIGRKHQVHFPRYHYDTDGLREFAAIINQYQKRLTISDGLGNLNSHIELLHGGTFGCIGLLRGWLMRAAVIASIRGEPINLRILKEARLSDDDLAKLYKEIIEGEALLKTTFPGDSVKTANQKEKSSVRKGKPFQKKPVRRKVGHRTRVGSE